MPSRSTETRASTHGAAGRSQSRAWRRSTKAGASAPATPGGRCTAGAPIRPLNEGRDDAPGDPSHNRLYARSVFSAQRGPGRRSPATRPTTTGESRPPRSLNEGRDISPGDTGSTMTMNMSRLLIAQRRPTRVAPNHTAVCPACPRRTPAALDKGRDVGTPATPLHFRTAVPSMMPAQRRPGRRPRRHDGMYDLESGAAICAQRRPGRPPRRHVLVLASHVPLRLVRSTKADASPPGDTTNCHG